MAHWVNQVVGIRVGTNRIIVCLTKLEGSCGVSLLPRVTAGQAKEKREDTNGFHNGSYNMNEEDIKMLLGQFFSTFLVLQPFNTAPHTVVTPTHTILFIATSYV